MAYKFDLPPSSEQLEAIGMVAVEWSYLESTIDAAIGILAGMTDFDALAAMTTHLHFRQRLDMLAALHSLDASRSDDNRAELKSVCSVCDRLSRKRNTIVHSRWIRGDFGSPMIMEVQARGRVERNPLRLSAEQIRGIAADIASATTRLTNVLSR